ncbi:MULTISPECIES: type II toxin-antitoxin system VapB family antitoxin [unclassified Caulobacter]|uniref:type II toxin-antitoxin system VapB family antitoxin n=1 Tax=unclassified Caulobacter TaxID=2648921 RepID=UPI0006FB9805|nr:MULTISPECIES: type II toxin-antitoxin system VapB family antitoxin [unclassified Caulobacter]KQZ17837.1 transcription factor [Caulobacter sp. Root1472]MDR7118812.1 antitoxin VapB [Caulobacter sp. BE254]
MPFHVRDAEADAMLRQYAEDNRVGITDAIKLAVRKAREADRKASDEKLARMRAISDRIARLPNTGLKADKAFFDELSGD